MSNFGVNNGEKIIAKSNGAGNIVGSGPITVSTTEDTTTIGLNYITLYEETDNRYLSKSFQSVITTLETDMNNAKDDITILENDMTDIETRADALEDRIAQNEIDIVGLNKPKIAYIDKINTFTEDQNLMGSMIVGGVIDARGGIDANSKKITNLGTPTDHTDAVTKLYSDLADDNLNSLINTNTGAIALKVDSTTYQSDKEEMANDIGLKASTTYVNSEIGKVNDEITDIKNHIKTQLNYVGEILTASTYKQNDYGYQGNFYYIAKKDDVSGDVSIEDNWRKTNAPQQQVDLDNYNTKDEIDTKLALYGSLAGENIWTGNNQFSKQIVLDEIAAQPHHAFRKGEFDLFLTTNTYADKATVNTFDDTQTFTKAPLSNTAATLQQHLVRKREFDRGLSPKANTSDVVLLTGNQDVHGQKTFKDDIKLNGATRKIIGTGVVQVNAPYEIQLISDNSNIVLNSSGAGKVVSSRIPIDMNNNKIQRLANPTENTDGVNLQYFNDNKNARDVILGEEFDTGIKLGADQKTVWERWVQVGNPYASVIVKVEDKGTIISGGINEFLGITQGVIRRNSGNVTQYQLHNINAVSNAPDQHASIVYQDGNDIKWYFNPSMTLSHFKDSPFFVTIRYTKA